MEGFLLDVGKTFVEKWITGAIEKSRYLFCFKCIAKEFNEERDKLEADRKTMRQRFRVAIEKDNKDIQFNAQFWDEQAEKLIHEDTKTTQICFFGFCPNCIWRYKRGKELANKIEEIKKLVEKGEKFENIVRYSSPYYISFESRELKYKELLDALKDDSCYIIGLYGMGGTGKTTLAIEVGKQLEASMQFNRVIVTTVSNTPNIKKIQDDIAGPLGLEWRNISESNRPTKLRSRLTNGEKILVILDDVWGYLNFDDIGIPNSENHKGCKILVTTRDRLVCNKMACDITIRLELLSEEDAWAMFKTHADLSNLSSEGLLKQGRKIAKECKGLPVAIATIASSLKGQNGREEWDVALKSLQKPLSMGGVEEYLVDIYKCLMFSYDNLNDKKAKELFLLCSVFQEDEEISIEILTRLGIGVGLFGEGYDKYNDARNLVVVAKNKLLDSCLLLKSYKRDVKMPDLIRKVAQWIANKEILVVNFSNKNQESLVGRDNIRYLLFEGNPMDLCSSRFDGSKLQILILIMVTGCFVDSFFENIAGLRVLNLRADYQFMPLPQSIRLLINLRSLIIEDADLGDISVLGCLQSLETLDLLRCKIDELPQEISKLTRLQLLNLEKCNIRSSNPFDVIQRCPSLEELYFRNSFNPFCLEITLPPALEWYQLIEGFGEMSDFSLSKCVSLQRDYFSEATFKHVIQTAEIFKLESIKKGWRNLMPEIVPIDEGMNDLIELCLKYDSQLECLIDTKHIGSSQVPNVFSNLVVLELERMDNLEELFNAPLSFESLENLEMLSIKDCKHLRRLSKYKLNLCNLKTIKVQNCPMLASLFESLTSRSLVLLEKLQIANCEGMENIISDERRDEESIKEIDDGDDNDNKSRGSIFPMLKVIDIEACPQLQYIHPFLSTQILMNLEKLSITDCKHLRNLSKCKLNLCNLKTIKVQNCPMLVSLFQPFTYQSLVLLEELQIANCKELENIISDERREEKSREEIDDDESCASMLLKLKVLDIEGSPRLEHILPLLSAQGLPVLEAIRIRRCDGIKNIFDQDHSMIYHLYTWERVQCVSILQSHSMCNIKEINLSHFSKKKSVFILSITPRLLVETLTITNWDELKNIVIDTVDQDSSGWGDVFPRLKRINIEDCIQLEYIFGQSSHDDHQNHNKVDLHLPTLEYINLCNLPRLVAMSTKQYHIKCPLLVELEHDGCSQVAIKSFRGFVTQPISKSQGIEISAEEGSTSTNAQTIPSSAHFEFPSSSSSQLIAPENKSTSHDYVDIEGSQKTTEINNQGSNIKEQIPKDDDVRVSKSNKQHLNLSYLLHMKNGIVSNNYEIVETEMNATTEGKQEFVVNIPGLVIKMKQRENSEIIVETKMKQTAEANQEFVVNVSGLEILEVANSQKLLNEQSTSQLREIDTAVKPSQLEGSTSEKTAATSTMSTISETKNDADIPLYAPKQKGTKTITSSTHSKSVSSSSGPLATSETSSLEYGDGQIAVASPPIVITKPLTTQDVDVKNSQETSKTNDDQVSLNKKVPESKPFPFIPSLLAFQTSSMLPKGDPSQIDEKLEDGDDKIAITSFSIAATDNNDQVSQNADALKKESSNVEEQFPKDDDIIVSKSPVASQFPTVPTKGDPSQKVEDLSTSLFVKTELEQLVSKKHLDYENLSLLTDFLIKHPSVRLMDASLSNRYKGCAYNLLADLLKFLKTHSVLEVLSSCHAEFVELLQDARSFDFDKDWLDGVERRTLLPDLQVSQDTLEKLLYSKQQITKDVEVQRLKIEDLKHQLSSSEAGLKNIIQQEANLSAPIGY